MSLAGNSLSKQQVKDSGLVIVLVLLIIAQLKQAVHLVPWAVIALLFALVVPNVYFPFARAWWALADLLSTISSRVILTIIFYLVVCPVGLLQRLLGKDNLKLNTKRDVASSSYFQERDHLFSEADLRSPF